MFYILSLISHFVLQLYSYKILKCEYWHPCWYMLNLVSAVKCQCQPTSGEYEPSNFFLDFTGILVHIQYVFYKFILCFTWTFCVVLHVRWWAHCEPGAVGSKLWPLLRASLLSVCLELWALHMGLATCLCTKLQCVTDTSRVEWKQPACFCILADSRGGTDGIFFAGLHTSHTAFERI